MLACRAPRVALSKDHKTILMYHPDEPIEYEKTIPIPRDDSRYNYECVEDKIRYVDSNGAVLRWQEKTDAYEILNFGENNQLLVG